MYLSKICYIIFSLVRLGLQSDFFKSDIPVESLHGFLILPCTRHMLDTDHP